MNYRKLLLDNKDFLSKTRIPSIQYIGINKIIYYPIIL